MSVARSTVFRATRAAQASARRAPVFTQAARSFTTSRALRNAQVIEKELPVTTNNPDGNRGLFTSTATSLVHQLPNDTENEADTWEITPLSRDVYSKLPSTMQKTTIMDKTVLLTGGARGLGNHMARACIEAGAKVIVIFDANQELGDQAAIELHEKTGIPVQFYKIDVRDGAAIDTAVAKFVEEHGAPDVLINSAGIADSNIKAEEYDHAMFRRLIDINLTGSFLMSQAVAKTMIAAGKPGSIVLVASMSGSIVNYPQEQSCYNASKAGVIQLGKSLAAEWAKHSIRVNCISPGYMDTALNNVPALDAQKKIWTSLTPQARLGAVDDLNGLAVFLASDASAFMTGANVAIDGGYTLY